MKIYIVRSSSLGDFILSIPALNLIRETFPNDQIYLYTYSALKKANKKNLDKYGANNLPWLFLIEILNFKIETKLFPSLFGYFMTALKNIIDPPSKIIFVVDEGSRFQDRIKRFLYFKILLGLFSKSFGMYWSINRFSEKNKIIHKSLGHARFYSQIFKLNIEDLNTKLKYPKVKKISLDNLITRLKINPQKFLDKKFISIDLGYMLSWKTWGIPNFILLIKKIEKLELNYPIIFVGIKPPKEDSEILNKFISNKENMLNLMGKTNLKELFSLLSKSKVHICNDGGSAHLADVAGTKVISIKTNIEEHGLVEPILNKKNSVFNRSSIFGDSKKDYPPYGKKVFPPGLEKIKVDAVYKKVIKYLK